MDELSVRWLDKYNNHEAEFVDEPHEVFYKGEQFVIIDEID